MSRSRKIYPIIKDKGFKNLYWKTIRSTVNQVVRGFLKKEDLDDTELPNPKTIINDYDYSDYKFVAKDKKDIEKFKRK